MNKKLLHITLSGVLYFATKTDIIAQEHGKVENLGPTTNLEINQIELLLQIKDAELEGENLKGQATIIGTTPQITMPNTTYLFANNQTTLKLPIKTTYQLQINADKYIATTISYDTQDFQEYYDTLTIALKPAKISLQIEITDIDTDFEDVPLEVVLTNKNRDEKITVDNDKIRDGKFTVDLRSDDEYLLQVNSNQELILYEVVLKAQDILNNPALANLDISLSKEKTPEKPKLKVGDKIELYNITFTPFSDVLDETSQAELERVIILVLDNPKAVIEVGGHTDNYDPYGTNAELSQKRAAAVVNFLVNKGVKKENLIIKGYGDSQPIASNATSEGRAANRRFELKVIAINE